uniref:hypothetical protein n=1 Tax=Ornithobacterium rhinotracheale TaxID=28251 RepID=UPI0039A6408B
MNLYAKDVISSGRIGVGEAAPTEKLHIKDGHIKIEDGTQQAGRVLTSDANGVGTWQALSMGNKMAQILFQSNNVKINTANYSSVNNVKVLPTKEIATSVASVYNEIDGLAYIEDKITLPAGKYFIFINHDIPSSEYCFFQVNRNNNNHPVYTTYYGEWLNTSFPLVLEKEDSISFYIKGFADASYNSAAIDNENGLPNPSPLFYLPEAYYEKANIVNWGTILKLN